MPYRNPADKRRCARRHYEENKRVYKARARAHTVAQRKKIRKYVVEYLSTHQCVDCGEKDPVVLEFDHRDPKTKSFNLADVWNGGYSLERIITEIKKCDVRCANCHRRRTYKQNMNGEFVRVLPVDDQFDLFK